MIRKSLFVSLLLTALIGTANAVPVTYYFSGALNDPFGNLVVGTLFNGSFSYDDSQPLNTPFFFLQRRLRIHEFISNIWRQYGL